jgi:glycosidase
MQVKNKVQLITYPDGLGGDLDGLERTLDEHFAGLFQGGIHVLPPFPSSADRGFAPLTYDEIDPRFGSWDDVRRLSERYDVMLDMIVNHVSRRSPYFSDFVARGLESEWAELFITLDKVWTDGRPVQADVDKIFLRRRSSGRLSARWIPPTRSTWIGGRPVSGPSSRACWIGSPPTESSW